MTSLLVLYYSYIKVIVDAVVPSEDGIVKKGEFKPGLVERSIMIAINSYGNVRDSLTKSALF
jgi:hypothetical protein